MDSVDSERITIIETNHFVVRAKRCLTDEARGRVIDMIATNPECGRIIKGGGGVRKVRFGIGDRGKRGGTRIVYFFYDRSAPVFLLTVFAKNERDDLTKAERNLLSQTAKQIVAKYGVDR